MKRQASTTAISARRKRQRTNSTSNVQAIVKKELRKKTDWKYTDASVLNAAISANGSIVSLLTNLTRGDTGFNNFEGNMIQPQAITFHYDFHTDQIYNVMRMMIFQWFDNSVPSVATVLAATTAGVGVLCPVATSAKPLLKVLYDKTVPVAPTANSPIQGCFVDKVYIPGKRLRKVQFNSGNLTVQTGNLFALYISDDTLTTFPGTYWYSRVTFSDN